MDAAVLLLQWKGTHHSFLKPFRIYRGCRPNWGIISRHVLAASISTDRTQSREVHAAVVMSTCGCWVRARWAQ